MTSPDEPPGQVLDEAPAVVLELAASAVDYVRAAVGVELDLTPDTLSVLDHYVVQVRPEMAQRLELRTLLTRTLGAYFGEVVRRSLGGTWWLPTEDIHDWRLCQRNVFLAFNPMGMAHDALLGSSDGGGPVSHLVLLPDERQLIFERLELVPPVPEDEYYLFVTRMEALEIAIETLRDVMRARGVEETEYEISDYEDQHSMV